MKNLLSPTLIKQSLTSHSWLGLLVGALMYLVCLSGTLVVFFEEFERWEQPGVAERMDYDPEQVEQAFNDFLVSGIEVTDHMYAVLPSESIPRVAVSSENLGRFVNPDGTLGPATQHEWTHMLTNLHLYLHLPTSWGMILVGALGAMLCGLIVTGFLAHPRIFRDAFSLRMKGAARLGQVDLHNRLSVWGSPFHLLIAVTGAWFGLVLPLLAIIGAGSGRSATEISESVFGQEPELDQSVQTVALARALRGMDEIAPKARPMYITVHKAGTPGQFMEVAGRHEDRLIYSENYRFDTEGNYLGKAGFSDGEAGKQAVYSIYRLHFGHFGGWPVKLLYGVLGLALSVVSVSGINIWLARRKKYDWLNPLWAGLVWGVPAALALTIITQVIFHIPSTVIFWLALAGAMMYGVVADDDGRVKWQLQALCSALLLICLVAYSMKHGAAAFGPAALSVNAGIVAVAFVLGWLAWQGVREPLNKSDAPLREPETAHS